MAPVGCWESLAAAIQAGATSVYFGIEHLNMRARSSVNFTTDDMSTIVATCREAGVKTYLTVNTVMYPEDLPLMREIVDKAHAGKPARLLLGTLFDQDITYLNGKEIGHTYYQYPPRRYDIPEGMLREGDNVITVRFINKYGMAHFIPEKPYMLAFGDDRKSLNPLPSDVIPR